jgi:aldose 1-epimerase
MPVDAALRPLAPGGLVRLSGGALAVDVAPAAGGRIAQIAFDGVEWLCGFADDNAAAIGWGSYPMLPWAGRIRRGRFVFEGREHRLPANLGAHAIHGVGFVLPWHVDARSSNWLELSLQLPEDETWPFGGIARQRIAIDGDALKLDLSVTAGARAMPKPVLGWHPWFRKPERIAFSPRAHYPRDAEGIATLPLAPPLPGPWDDCFVNTQPVTLHRAGQSLTLTSDCDHWVVFDEPAHATCVEPQNGPPDAFNLDAAVLAPGRMLAAWFHLHWR